MATRKKPERLLVARQTITVEADGEKFPLLAGVTHVPASHPAAKAQPEAFAEAHRPDDADAAEAPNEQRGRATR